MNSEMKMKTRLLLRMAGSLGLVLGLLWVNPRPLSANPNAPLQQLYEEGMAALDAGNFEEAMLKLGRVLEARPDHARSRAAFQRAQLQMATDPGRSYRRQVASLVMREIDVQDVTMSEFVDYIRATVAAAQEDEEEVFVPNILLQGEGVNRHRFTLRLRNIPLDEVLRMAGQMAGVDFRYDRHAIFGTAAGGDAAEPEPASAP